MARRYERVLFQKAPLRLALAQVRFPPLLRFGDDAFLAPFQEQVADAFPDYAKQNQATLEFTPSGAKASGEVLWKFTNRDGTRSLVLTQTALTLESRTFIEIGEFSEQLGRVLSSAEQTLHPRERTRLGLRYVNEFRSPEGSRLSFWRARLNPDLVGCPEACPLPGAIERTLQEIHTRTGDDALVVRHGLLQGQIVEPLPGEAPPPDPWAYVLDMDAFSDKKGKFDIATTIAQMKTFNDRMYQFFRWAIDGGTVYPDLEPHAP